MSITLSQIKKALKIDFTQDDQELLRIRDAAISLVQSYTGLDLEPKTKIQYLSYWMRTRLEFSPFNSITSVKYTATDGTLTTMSTDDWFLDRSFQPSVFINFLAFPILKEGTQIEVTYAVGYSDYPKEVEQLIISLVGNWYNNPEAVQAIGLSEVPLSAKFILENMKINGVIA